MPDIRRQYLKTPLALPALSFACGILLLRIIPSPAGAISLSLLSLVVFSLCLFTQKKRDLVFLCGSLLLFCTLGNTSAWLHSPPSFDSIREAIHMRGLVESSVMTTDGARSTVNVSHLVYTDGSTHTVSSLRILLHTDDSTLSPGYIVNFPSRPTPVTDIPVLDTDIYAARMRTQGIICHTRADASEVTEEGPGKGIRSIALRWRGYAEDMILSSRLRPAAKTFITAILIGERSLLSSSTSQELADAGIAHILALSGLHLAIISAILAGLLLPVDLILHYKARFIIVILLIWVFTVLTGLAPSTLRACMMATVFYTDILLERPHSKINSLCLAALVILAISPSALVDPGFQLSITCVGTIILFSETMNPFRRREHPRLYALTSAVVSSTTAALGSWLLTACYFGKLTLLALPANLLVIPLMFPYLLLATVHSALLPFGLDAAPLRLFLDNGAEALGVLARATASSTVDFHPGAAAPLLWAAGIVLTAIALHHPHHGRLKYIPASLCLCSALAFALLFPKKPEHALIVSTSQGTPRITYRHSSGSGTDFFLRGVTTIQTYGQIVFAIIQEKPESIEPFAKADITHADVILLAGSFKGSLSDLIPSGSKPTVILGPHLRSHVRQNIIQEATRLGLKTHSLRDDGALRLPLQ